MKNKYCCVLSMTLDISKSKKYFLMIANRLWDKKHKKKKATPKPKEK